MTMGCPYAGEPCPEPVRCFVDGALRCRYAWGEVTFEGPEPALALGACQQCEAKDKRIAELEAKIEEMKLEARDGAFEKDLGR